MEIVIIRCTYNLFQIDPCTCIQILDTHSLRPVVFDLETLKSCRCNVGAAPVIDNHCINLPVNFAMDVEDIFSLLVCLWRNYGV